MTTSPEPVDDGATEARLARKIAFLERELAVASSPNQRFEITESLDETRAQLTELQDRRGTGRLGPTGHGRRPVDVAQVTRYASSLFVGRDDELAVLDQAWAAVTGTGTGTGTGPTTQASTAEAAGGGDGQRRAPHVISFVALGGEGKTALVADWLMRLAEADWPGADGVFAWSFHSQGVRRQSGAPGDQFLAEALRHFGDPVTAESSLGSWDKGRRLAQLIAGHRVLLVLDGLEPLQHPPDPPMEGRVADPGVAALLQSLATTSRGLCVVTTRHTITDLGGHRSLARSIDLTALSRPTSMSLLRSLEVTGPDGDLDALAASVADHALSVQLFGVYLRDAYGGDVGRRHRVNLATADAARGGSAAKLLDAYLAWLAPSPLGSAAAQLLGLAGLFDRPIPADCLDALLAEPPIDGLTDQLTTLDEVTRNLALSRLEQARLVTLEHHGPRVASIDAHPLVRSLLADRLRSDGDDRWRAGQERLYQHLCATADEGEQPSLDDLQPLYHAIAHGCHAGLHQHACDTVYRDRICRGDEFYATDKLGAVAADLAAIAAFFDTPFTHPNSTLTPAAQSWLTGEAGSRLRALGRLTDALPLFHTALTADIATGDRRNAAIYAGNLSELQITLGDLAGAATTAATALTHANHTTDPFQQLVAHTQLGAVHHQQGHLDTATTHFTQAETLQTTRQPSEPRLSSYQGFQYCELLGQPTETAAWHHHLNPHHPVPDLDHHTTTLTHLTQRADHALTIAQHNRWLLDIGLDTLTQARTTLHHHLLHTTTPTTTDLDHATHAITTLRQANTLHELPSALLTRAALHTIGGHHDHAITDMNEAWDLTQQGPMPLYEIDTLLHRTRLYGPLHLDGTHPYPWTDLQTDLTRTAELIHRHGYHRRDQELTDTIAALRR